MIRKEQNRTAYNKLMRFIKFRILHANDSPHRIALGVALGIFIAWMPVFGLHILVALGLCIILRANKLAALACVWVSNPFTLVPIYYSDYFIGKAALKSFNLGGATATDAHVRAMFAQFSPGSFFSNLFQVEFWGNMLKLVGEIGYELWVGAIIIGSLISIGAYFLTYYFIVQHRRKSRRRRFLQYQ